MTSNPNKKRCGAKRKNGEPCQQWGMANGRCRLHGGNARRGLAHPGLKHGRYSKDVPTRFSEMLATSLTDPDLLNLSEEIALETMRTRDLLRRVDSGESGALWNDLRKAWSELRAAQRAKDTIGVNTIMTEIETLIGRGTDDAAVWREIGSSMDRRRKLVDTERRRRIDMQTMMTAERAGVMFYALTEVILRHVHEPDTLNAIITEFGDIIGHDDAGTSHAVT